MNIILNEYQVTHSEAGRNMGEASGLVDAEANVGTSCSSAIWQKYLFFAKQLARVFRFV